MAWEITRSDAEVLAVHAALLPGGKILYFGGSEHNSTQNLSGNAADLDNTRVYDPEDPGTLVTISSPSTDVFCAGHSILADGRLLVAGGTEEWGSGDGHGIHLHGLNFLGERAAWIYSPRANRWDRVRDMSFEPGTTQGGGRWYPTLVTLANGQSLAIAGHTRESDSRHNNDSPERYNPATNSWAQLDSTRVAPGDRGKYYPRAHVMPTGDLFFSTPSGGNCRLYDPNAGAWVGAGMPTAGLALYDDNWHYASTLLPLLPGDNYRARVMVTGDQRPRIIDPLGSPAIWGDAGTRDFTGIAPRRQFGCAVILPTGQVFLSGGIDSLGADDSDAERRGEIYTPSINWTAGASHTGNGTWNTVEEATVTRNYHSTALLQPDGRVWTAGSSKNAAAGNPSTVAEMRIEVYKPPYDGDANRPTIAGAPASVGYEQRFTIQCEQAEIIERVAFVRAGSITHAFDADQRYVGAEFEIDGNDIFVTAPPHSAVAPPGHYMLWVVDNNNLPCVHAPMVRVCDQRLFVVTDRSTFSTHEIEALGSPASFRNAFYLTLDGFLPGEAGLPLVQPQFQFRWADGGTVPGLRATVDRVEYEDPSVPPDIAQRITFVCNVVFENASAFEEIAESQPARDIVMEVQHGAHTAVAPLTLTKNPNPYMRDGATHWLSTDLRVFALTEGSPFGGLTLGSGDDAPITFISQLLNRFNMLPTDEDHPFFDIETDREDSQLFAARLLGGVPVHNFAVAKVRMRAPAGIEANDARVFFRLFRTVATGFEYQAVTYPRIGDGTTAVPMLGRNAGEIASIPFFAEARTAALADQLDPINRQTLAGAGATEVTVYFGCWLDFNQPEPRFPLTPAHDGRDGAFTSDLLSLQELLRNHHCCLVAEVHYPPDPIPIGTTPGAHENLAQRNLVVVPSDNPGSAATHTVQSTFEVKPSKVPITIRRAFGRSPIADDALAVQYDAINVTADELLIRWGNMPRDSRVSLFLPGVDVEEIAAAAGQRNGPVRLQAREAQTLLCAVGDQSWIPLPGPQGSDLAGLLTVELPPTVAKGEHFSFTVHQVTSALFNVNAKLSAVQLEHGFGQAAAVIAQNRRGYRRVTGAFQFDIPVHHAGEILTFELDRLAVMKHIAAAIPTGNKWEPVFGRLISQIGDRVRGFGVDPADVPGSPDGGVICSEDHGQGDNLQHCKELEPVHCPYTREDDHNRNMQSDATIDIGYVHSIEYDHCGRISSVTLANCGQHTRIGVAEWRLNEVFVRACHYDLRVRVARRGCTICSVDIICC